MLYAARSGSAVGPSGVQLPSARRVLFGATGWAPPRGQHCIPHTSMQIELLPRDLSLDPQSGELLIRPIPELASLRKLPSAIVATLRGSTATVTGMPSPDVRAASGSLLELRLNCSGVPTAVRPGTFVGLRILVSGDFHTTVGFNYSASHVFLDHTHSAAAAHTYNGVPSTLVQTAPVAAGASGTVSLAVFVDNGLVEIYANERVVMSQWVTEVMNETEAALVPKRRTAAPLQPPEGTVCHFNSWELSPLPPFR